MVTKCKRAIRKVANKHTNSSLIEVDVKIKYKILKKNANRCVDNKIKETNRAY